METRCLSEQLIEALEKLARELPGGKRLELKPELDLVSSALGLRPDEVRHLSWPLPAWPKRGESSSTKDDVYRYAVDFAHGERPDHRNFVATFEQVRRLLNYTAASCKVAFGTGKGKVDRTQRATRLGPCVILRLPHAIDPDEFSDVVRFDVKLAEAEGASPVTTDAAGRSRRVPRGGNKY